MECREVLSFIVDYYEGTLGEDQLEAIQEHLSMCPVCSQEYLEHDIAVQAICKANHEQRKGIAAGSDFEEWMRDALQAEERTPRRRKGFAQRLAVAAAAFALIMVVTFYTPVYATIRDGISNLLDYALGDRGIENSLEQGFGQLIEKKSQENGVTFTVHSFISDENRSVLLLSTQYLGAAEGEADNMSLYGMSIADKSGDSITGSYSTKLRYDAEQQLLTGHIDLGTIHSGKREIYVGFESAVLSKREVIQIPLRLSNQSMTDLDMVLDLNTETISRVVLKNIDISGSLVSIEYDVEYTDPKFRVGSEQFRLVDETGSGIIYMSGSMYSTGDNERISHVKEQFSFEELDFESCTLEFSYQHALKVIDGDWQVRFKPDQDIAKASTKSVTVNRDIVVGGYPMRITKVSFSPSTTGVHIEGKGISPLSVLGPMVLRTGDGEIYHALSGTRSVSQSTHPEEAYEALFTFDPIYAPEGMTLVVEGATFPKTADLTLDFLMDTPEEVQNVVLDGNQVKVTSLQAAPDMISVFIQNLEHSFGYLSEVYADGIYLVDSKGQKRMPESDGIGAKSVYGTQGIFDWRGVPSGGFTLHIESILAYQRVYQEIEVIE